MAVIDLMTQAGLVDKLNNSNELILGIIIISAYYIAFEGISGRTIGKFITRTKVVTETGEEPEFSHILKRTFCRFIPFESFSFLDSKRTGWHDRFSNTQVVEIE